MFPEFMRLQHDLLWLETGHRSGEQGCHRKEEGHVTFPLTLAITRGSQPCLDLASSKEAAERLLGSVCYTTVASARRALRRKKEINLHCLSSIIGLATIRVQIYNKVTNRFFFLNCFRYKEAEAQGNRITWPRITQLLVKKQSGVLNPWLWFQSMGCFSARS